MTQDEEIDKILRAQPVKELPDKAHVKWPRFKRYRRRERVLEPYRPRPDIEEAKRALELEGRDLETCEECGSEEPPMAIHHLDGNPYNSDPPNLRILCFNCHQNHHGPADSQEALPWYAENKKDYW